MLKSQFDDRIGVDRGGVQHALTSAAKRQHLQKLVDPRNFVEYYTPEYPRWYTMDTGIGQNLAPLSINNRQTILDLYRKANMQAGMMEPITMARGYSTVDDKQTIVELEADLLKQPVSYFDIMGMPHVQEIVYDAAPFSVTNQSQALPHYDYLQELAHHDKTATAWGVFPGVTKYLMQKIERPYPPNYGHQTKPLHRAPNRPRRV
jgi:hypothetical protein